MKLLKFGGLWIMNCLCWLMLGLTFTSKDMIYFLVLGVSVLIVTIALSNYVLIRPAAVRRSQVNPDRYALNIPPLYR